MSATTNEKEKEKTNNRAVVAASNNTWWNALTEQLGLAIRVREYNVFGISSY